MVVLLMIFLNYTLISTTVGMAGGTAIAVMIAGAVIYLLYAVFPGRISGDVTNSTPVRLQILYGGCELILVSAVCLMAEIILYLVFWPGMTVGRALINAIICGALLFALAAEGVIRLLVISKQVKMAQKLLLLLMWWIPVLNMFMIWKVCRIARMEYEVEVHRQEMNEVRRETQICHTRYPVLMVHGVFFRDWHYFNYWGRIPAELVRNGAVVYYGNQQSALPVRESARELKRQLLEIVRETGCEKVNIIAHSKGGLDSRYAISCLEAAPYVASLTTISTPHYGCRWVDEVLKKLPGRLVKWVAGKYNTLFRRLGDSEPDFYGAVYDLTESYSKRFNEEAKNQDGILYQSVMSRMDSAKSSGFPLNLTYRIINKIQCCRSDGLVPLESAVWGQYLGHLKVDGKRGISHGDMIDLNRENIRGFDVREFYIDLIKGLGERGL